ncbi:hypothetical protein BC835DRAFT_1418207 [Cytidiella melzeri]|nr:hypothetical protein BC835DRAFT_1418207 [Cytidiella melzeri]
MDCGSPDWCPEVKKEDWGEERTEKEKPARVLASFTTPNIHTTSDTSLGWPQDPFQPLNPSPTNVRPDRPRLIAPAYKWQALP